MIKFKDYIYSRIKNVTEQEMKDTNVQSVISICKNFRILLSRNIQIPIQYCDELLLTYFFNNLVSKSLERRIKGITYINKFIDAILKNESSMQL